MRRTARRNSIGEIERLETRWAMAASLSLSGPTGVVYEGDKAAFTLTLSEPLRTVETVFISTAPGTATYGVDYFAPPSTQLSFSPGQTQKTFSIATLRENGNRVEGVETFQVIVTPANRALGVRSATVRIDDFFAEPSVSISDAAVVEGNSGTTAVAFSVTLSAPSRRQVTVNYATRDGSATVADRDYAAANGTLTFAPGETSKTITVGVIGDTKFESRESYSIALSAPTNAWLLKQNGYGYIDNDDAVPPPPPPTSQFNIDIAFEVGVSPTSPIRALARTAADRWQQVIIGDLPDVTARDNQGNTRLIDDLLIGIGVSNLGGDIIAQARFLDIRVGNTGVPANWQPGSSAQNGLPYLGNLTINSAYENAPGILNTIIHEIGHVLGFGTLWGNNVGTYSSLVSGIGTNDPRYSGANALREYNRIFGATGTSVPLYEQSDLSPPNYDGSYGGHWRDSVFNNLSATNQYFELMTARYDVTATLPGGGPIPSYLSTITVGAMQDLGYRVNYAAADNYTRPPQPTNLVAAVAAATSTKPSTPAINSTLPRPVTTQPVVVAPAKPVTTTTTPRTPVKTTTPPRAPTQVAVSPISKATASVRIVQR